MGYFKYLNWLIFRGNGGGGVDINRMGKRCWWAHLHKVAIMLRFRVVAHLHKKCIRMAVGADASWRRCRRRWLVRCREKGRSHCGDVLAHFDLFIAVGPAPRPCETSEQRHFRLITGHLIYFFFSFFHLFEFRILNFEHFEIKRIWVDKFRNRRPISVVVMATIFWILKLLKLLKLKKKLSVIITDLPFLIIQWRYLLGELSWQSTSGFQYANEMQMRCKSHAKRPVDFWSFKQKE